MNEGDVQSFAGFEELKSSGEIRASSRFVSIFLSMLVGFLFNIIY